jgi:hypothetical protein
MSNRAAVIEVHEDAENNFTTSVQSALKGSVFSAGCSNWYINSAGNNSASWPGYASAFWRKTYFPRFADYDLRDGDKFWFPKTVVRNTFSLVFSKYVIGVGLLMCLSVVARNYA